MHCWLGGGIGAQTTLVLLWVLKDICNVAFHCHFVSGLLWLPPAFYMQRPACLRSRKWMTDKKHHGPIGAQNTAMRHLNNILHFKMEVSECSTALLVSIEFLYSHPIVPPPKSLVWWW